MDPAAHAVEAAVAAALEGYDSAPVWLVGFSGGLDSTALLLALSRLRAQRQHSPPLHALHVHPGLSPDASDWETHCRSICKEFHIECQVRRVTVQPAGEGPEAAARRARHAVFRELLDEGGVLLLAHHQDDQIETFFLRLMRGAGVRGLSGMAALRPLGAGTLLRPFLGLPRAQLEDYVRGAGLAWIEDPSNRDTALDRNYLRREVLPRLEARWPGYRAPVTRAMAHLAASESGAGAPELATCHNAFGDPGFDLCALRALGAAESARALRGWLQGQGCQAPPQDALHEFLRQLADSTPERHPRLERRDWCLQRFAGAVYLLPWPARFEPPAPLPVEPGQSLTLAGVGRVRVLAPEADGVAGSEEALSLRFRRGGEWLRVRGRRQRLKTLLQDAQVPPWWRERLPLLYRGDDLLAAGEGWRREGAPCLEWEPHLPHRAD
jgi:tRNA(Ile)-lysidine synthase